MTRAQKLQNNRQQVSVSSDQLNIAVSGINRVFGFTKKDAEKNLNKSDNLKKAFILDVSSEFDKRDFDTTKDDSFSVEEIEVLNALNVNPFKKKAAKKEKKADRYTRNKALKNAIESYKKPFTKEQICIKADKLYREKNPETKAPEFTSELKNHPSEFHFRYGFDLLLEMGFAEKVKDDHFQMVAQSDNETEES